MIVRQLHFEFGLLLRPQTWIITVFNRARHDCSTIAIVSNNSILISLSITLLGLDCVSVFVALGVQFKFIIILHLPHCAMDLYRVGFEQRLIGLGDDGGC